MVRNILSILPACLWLVGGLVAIEAAGAGPGKPLAKDAKTAAPDTAAKSWPLQGTWICTAAKEKGAAAPRFLNILAVMERDNLTWHYPRRDGASSLVKAALFRLDPGGPGGFDQWRPNKPKEVDRRLYSLKGDELIWSTSLDGRRPASLDSGRFQFTMRRALQAPMLTTAVDPDDDCNLRLYKNQLRIQVPAGTHDLWYKQENPAKRFNAPRMFREAEGDFVAQVKVTSTVKVGPPLPSGRSYQGAGLVVWDSEKQYLRLERAQQLAAGREVHYCYGPMYDLDDRRLAERSISDPRYFAGEFTWLRIERRGQDVTTSVSADGQTWTITGKVSTRFPPHVRVGVEAISLSAAPFVALFEDFKLAKN